MNTDAILIEKWKNRIPKGWYGFDGIPAQWVNPINEFLEQVESLCPKFEIQQIKLKFGGIRIYLELNCKDGFIIDSIEERIEQLEKELFDEKLIY